MRAVGQPTTFVWLQQNHISRFNGRFSLPFVCFENSFIQPLALQSPNGVAHQKLFPNTVIVNVKYNQEFMKNTTKKSAQIHSNMTFECSISSIFISFEMVLYCKITHPSSSVRIMYKHYDYYCYFSLHILLLLVVAQRFHTHTRTHTLPFSLIRIYFSLR